MKRCWIGAAVLAALLVAGIVTGTMMDRIHRPVAWRLTQAAELAQAGLWDEAETEADRARQEWDDWRYFRGTLADHTPVEDAQALFAQLPVYAREEDAHFTAICLELAERVNAIAEAHTLDWWDVL